MPFTFQKATRTEAKARVALAGPAGSGKTWDALEAATVLAGPNGKIAGNDTERGSMSLYASDFNFDVMELTPKIGYAPKNFVEAIHAAEKAGYDVIVIDSLSHEWEGEGGALEMVDDAAQRARGNSYVAWRNVTPEPASCSIRSCSRPATSLSQFVARWTISRRKIETRPSSKR